MRTLPVSATLARYTDGGRSKCRRERRCRMCLTPRQRRGARQLTRHHLVPQSWFEANGLSFRLRDADANVVPLCARCHRAVETDAAARRMLRKVLAQAEVAFCVQVRGRHWLADRYPPPPRSLSVRAAA